MSSTSVRGLINDITNEVQEKINTLNELKSQYMTTGTDKLNEKLDKMNELKLKYMAMGTDKVNTVSTQCITIANELLNDLKNEYNETIQKINEMKNTYMVDGIANMTKFNPQLVINDNLKIITNIKDEYVNKSKSKMDEMKNKYTKMILNEATITYFFNILAFLRQNPVVALVLLRPLIYLANIVTTLQLTMVMSAIGFDQEIYKQKKTNEEKQKYIDEYFDKLAAFFYDKYVTHNNTGNLTNSLDNIPPEATANPTS